MQMVALALLLLYLLTGKNPDGSCASLGDSYIFSMIFSKMFNRLKQILLKNTRKQTVVSETSKVRGSLARFCTGNGLDIGYGGDPIVADAICLDLPERYANYKQHPQHLHGDAQDLYWFKDECLDYVYSAHLLEDFEDTASVLSEWIRVVKPGGLLVLYLPDEKAYRRYCAKHGKPPNPYHIHEDFSISYIKRILKDRDDVEIIHEKSPSGIYSFELVLKKCKKGTA